MWGKADETELLPTFGLGATVGSVSRTGNWNFSSRFRARKYDWANRPSAPEL